MNLKCGPYCYNSASAVQCTNRVLVAATDTLLTLIKKPFSPIKEVAPGKLVAVVAFLILSELETEGLYKDIVGGILFATLK